MIRLELVTLVGVFVVAALMVIIGIWHGRRFSYYAGYSDFGSIFIMGGAVIGGFSVLCLAVLAAPYNPHYWFYDEHSGTIDRISNRFVDASGDVSSDTYVVTLDGKALTVDDPRILGYDVGESISLNCLPVWVYGGGDRYECKIR